MYIVQRENTLLKLKIRVHAALMSPAFWAWFGLLADRAWLSSWASNAILSG